MWAEPTDAFDAPCELPDPDAFIKSFCAQDCVRRCSPWEDELEEPIGPPVGEMSALAAMDEYALLMGGGGGARLGIFGMPEGMPEGMETRVFPLSASSSPPMSMTPLPPPPLPRETPLLCRLSGLDESSALPLLPPPPPPPLPVYRMKPVTQMTVSTMAPSIAAPGLSVNSGTPNTTWLGIDSFCIVPAITGPTTPELDASMPSPGNSRPNSCGARRLQSRLPPRRDRTCMCRYRIAQVRSSRWGTQGSRLLTP